MGLGFDAFRKNAELAPVAHGDTSDGDRCMLGFVAQVLHKCTVDLEGIDREPLENRSGMNSLCRSHRWADETPWP